MAIKNLEQELEQVFSQIFKPGQLNPKAKKKGDKGGGSEDPVRKLLDLYSFRFRITPSDIEEQILDYKVSTGRTVKKQKIFKNLLKEEDRGLVKEVAKEIVKGFKNTKPAKSKNYKFSIEKYEDGIQLLFETEDTVSEQSIYNVANTLKTKVSKQVFGSGKGKQLFDKMSQSARSAKDGDKGEKLTEGGIFNVGHDYPVARVSAALLQDGVDSVEGSELVSEETKAIKDMVQNKLGEFSLDFAMAREAAIWQGGKLKPNPTQRFFVETNLETKFKNQVQAQQKGGEGATKVGDAAGELLREIRQYLEDRYKEAGAKGWTQKQMSTPFIDQIGAGFVFQKSLQELYKRGLAKNITEYKQAPSDTRLQRTKNKSKKYKTKSQIGTLGLGAPKGIKSKPVQEKGAGRSDLAQQQAIQNAFVTRAFVNARLSKQVSGNMGRPALINRTGRFAESVTITNASSRGNLTHFDYTYDPIYKVFEGGDNYTPNYDPRPLIEKSIRQLAAARLETKFTLRRV